MTAYYPDELEAIIGIFCEQDDAEQVEERSVGVLEFLNG